MASFMDNRRIVTFGAVILAVFVFAFGLRLYWFSDAPLPELLQGLPDSKSEADQQAFIARLQKKLSSEATELAIASALEAQGFRIDAARRAANYEKQASLNDKCRRSGNVRWTADAEGKILSLTGGYTQHCPY